MKRFRYHVSMIKRGLAMLMQIEKGFIVYYLLINAFSAFTPYVNIFMAAKIIDELLGARNTNTLILYVSLTIGLNAVLSLVHNGLQHLRDYHQNMFYGNHALFFSEKIMSMDYENIENRDVHLLRERIRMETQTGYNIFHLYNSAGNFLRVFIEIALSVSLTFGLFFNGGISLISKLIMLALIVSVVILNYFLSKNRDSLFLDMYDKFVDTNAIFNFYDDFYSDYEAGKDVRMYSMEETILNENKKMNDFSYNLNITTAKKAMKFDIANSMSSNVMKIAIYVFLILACIGGSVTVGSIAMYVSCVLRMVQAFTGMASYVQTLITNNKYLENFFAFFDIPANMYKGTLPVEKRRDGQYEIEFKNVSFKYPGSDTYALKNLSMKLNIGQRMAVVGMNGSGKTTMIKLLCRLYDPTEGEITLNGFDIKKYDYDEYLRIFSVVFQDFKLFSFNLGQNVATAVDYDADKVQRYLELAGLTSLPNGLETPLYKDFDDDGIEISGGEAQKIALARALYKDAPFIILDEPTAALDPVAEYEVYSKFNDIAGGKTAVYISHRLSSCRFCDDIAVFHQGELIERGNHDTLISDTDSKYYELWNAQAQYYTK